jgi:hypothetical protein
VKVSFVGGAAFNYKISFFVFFSLFFGVSWVLVTCILYSAGVPKWRQSDNKYGQEIFPKKKVVNYLEARQQCLILNRPCTTICNHFAVQ